MHGTFFGELLSRSGQLGFGLLLLAQVFAAGSLNFFLRCQGLKVFGGESHFLEVQVMAVLIDAQV
ncbi:hypothetical protein ACFRAU_16380 [Arthrobacter sp. NPDC056691]|uniref:hypothetical protein n=1 Tax=Arthrobacter sp. NPDC056691 TaxID=3345913 RepID=UPI00366FBF4C